ncbi:MAG: carboxypeptidase-like regulatory domain-containing protein [Bacteroidales bacterium]|nr:carboxypeptidase-like regulatory domain-containing protein [Bacteroidales bacterium]
MNINRILYIATLQIIAFLLFTSSKTYAQSLQSERFSTPVLYIYKITNQQAEEFYTDKVETLTNDFFAQYIDTLSRNRVYTRTFPTGHYLFTEAKENFLKSEIKSFCNFTYEILDNQTDLAISVLDKATGLPITNAKVKLGHCSIKFDKKTRTYRRTKTDKDGILSIEVDGMRTFYKIKKRYNLNPLKRAVNGINSTPVLNLITRPLTFVFKLPFDAVTSIKKGYAYGTIRTINRTADRIFNPSDYDNSEYRENNGFMILNKPRYRTNDTIKLKALVLDKNNKPYDKPLLLRIYTEKMICIDTLKPKRPGIYYTSFIPKPEYGLKLDRYYSLSLSTMDDKTLVSRSFKYENYELKSAEYEMSLPKNEYLRHDSIEITLKAHDENNLPLPDARVDLELSVQSVEQFDSAKIQFPEKLWTKTVQIDPTGEMKFLIPDSIFPPATLQLKLSGRFNNSDNQSKNVDVHFKRIYSYDKINCEQKGDSFTINFTHKGKFVTGISANMTRGILPDTMISLPAIIRINPLVTEYKVSYQNNKESFSPQQGTSGVKCTIQQAKDSLFASIENPYNLPLAYTIYKNSCEIKRGTGTNLDLKLKAFRSATYYISVQYVWGGRAQSVDYYAHYAPPKMNISAILPSVAFPGQKIEVKLAVTDDKGKPMPNVDLTATGYTAKFHDDLSIRLPYNENYAKGRRIYNSFRSQFNSLNLSSSDVLDYEKWKTTMRLDTIEMYRFAYPDSGFYQLTSATPDSVSLIAPYLVHEGKILPINMLYIDDMLVYSNEATTNRPYWFRILPGKHRIKMRTVLKSILFNIDISSHNNYIVSVDPDKYSHDVVFSKKAKYSYDEQNELARSLVKIRYNYNDDFAFLHQGKFHFEILENKKAQIAGPFENNTISYQNINSFSRNFTPDNELFEYEFLPNVTKMRSTRNYDWVNYKTPSLSFQQKLLTLNCLDSLYKDYLKQKLRNNIQYKNELGYSSNAAKIKIKPQIPHSIFKKALGWSVYNTGERRSSFYRPYVNSFDHIPAGQYNLILLLDDFTFYVINAIEIKENSFTLMKFSLNEMSFSKENLQSVYPYATPFINAEKTIVPYLASDVVLNAKHIPYNPEYVGSITVSGIVMDNEKEPIIGATIAVNGTKVGAVTDINGKYTITVPSGYRTLTYSYIGCNTQTFIQQNTGILNVILPESIVALQEVFAVGYGVHRKSDMTGSVSSMLAGKSAGVSVSEDNNISIRGISSLDSNAQPLYVIDGVISNADLSKMNPADIQKFEVLKDASATAIYGSRGANGVILITTKKGGIASAMDAKRMMQQLLSDGDFQSMQSSGGKIRSNFSDELFWQPALTTDKNGIASFETTLPDDVTKWKSWYVGVLPGKAAAMTNADIRSFMPVVGQLSLPRFILQGDKANVIGKSINYTGDSIQIESSFSIDNKLVKTKSAKILNAMIDTVQLTSNSRDSVTVEYVMKRYDGFRDGESRSIPIIKQGTEETIGQFFALDRDTTLSLSANQNADSTILYAESDALELLKKELRYLSNYQHLCNEQSASRLKALLLERDIYNAHKQKFHYEKQIRDLISRVEKGKNSNGFWGWFGEQKTEIWISIHATEALIKAKNAGYTVHTDFEKVAKDLLWQFDQQSASEQIRTLRLLREINPKGNYEASFNKMKPNPKSLSERLGWMELKSHYTSVKLDTLMQTKQTDLFGNCYWLDKKDNLMENNTVATLIAYRMIKKEGKNPELLAKIRNFLFAQRKNGCWRNTYESASILETILPDLLTKTGKIEKSKITLTGSLTMAVDSFPLRIKIPQNSAVTVTKSGSYPVYLTTYSRIFNPTPQSVDKGFEVKSYLENNATRLSAGKPIKLLVDVTIKEEQEFVLVEIPIPASCSYADKKQNWNESHREYFTEKVCIYLRRLGKGKTTFTVNLEPRFTGKYGLNPAKAEKMYFPVFYGRTGMSNVEIGK